MNKETIRLQVSAGNTKIGKTANISLLPIVTCAKRIPCAKKCYARRLLSIRKSLRDAWARNTNLWFKHPDLFEQLLIKFLDKYRGRYFRWFVGGDIPDTRFYKMMVRLAKRYPRIQFAAYSKKYGILKQHARANIPNLVIAVSVWKGDDKRLMSLDLPKIWYKDKTVSYPKEWFTCPGSCVRCRFCYKMGKTDNVVINAH